MLSSDKKASLLNVNSAHMHDGGVNTEIFKNNQLICKSLPHYAKGTSSHGMRRRQIAGGSYSNNEIEHIYRQDTCKFPDGVAVKKGDKMHLTVNYDFKKYPG